MHLSTFYQSPEWIKLRAVLINERTTDEGYVICAHCGEPILRKYDIIGHHITELTEDNVNDVSISLNPDNVELIHFKCHNKKHQRFDGFRQFVYLVYGSPCAGKSSWVRENAYEDDLILDIDSIWEAVCRSDKLHKPGRLKANVFGIRDCIIEQIKLRKGMWRNAYIIGGYPLRSDRQRLCEMLGAKEIFIDTPEDVCLSRAESEEWKDYIREWFEDYSA